MRGLIPWRIYTRPQCIPWVHISTAEVSERRSLQSKLNARHRLMKSTTGSSFLCFRKRGKIGFLFAFLLYWISSTSLGVISIASAPGGDNISCPIPFLFLFCHIFFFFGFFIFQKNILPAKQPLVPLLFGTLLYFLPYFPNLEWLEGWIEGLDLFLLLLGLVLFICREENE